MKIEQVNENQIRCILNKCDLQARNIKLNELAYGTTKTDILFKEMTEQAHKQFGFKIDDSPLMIEAIPLSDESIVLVITKVEDPEELDTRFSRFSPDRNPEGNKGAKISQDNINATDILSLINTFKDSLASENSNLDFMSKSPKDELFKKHIDKMKKQTENLVIIFQFDNIDKLIGLSKVLKEKYKGRNSLYKQDNVFYLTLEKATHTPEEFNQICNIICEYGSRIGSEKISPLHISEHSELILENNALQELANI